MIVEKKKKTSLRELSDTFIQEEALLKQGGGFEGKERQKRLGRMTVRERLHHLLDNPDLFFELGIWAGYRMYEEIGGLPCAAVVTGIGEVCNRPCMIIANDATVKAGAMFPESVKKVLRAQRIAYENLLPILYLVDSSGVYLPLQAEIFPDEDDFGRIFRNNAILSAQGIPQFAAIMGNCIAGGGYLPVLCDQLLMTEGSGLYLAGPALVKAAIGQEVTTEELGGVKMHAELSGTVDFHEPDDLSCIKRLRSLVNLLSAGQPFSLPYKSNKKEEDLLYDLIGSDGNQEYDTHKLLQLLCDQDSIQEYKEEYGKPLICAFAKIDKMALGIVANQRMRSLTGKGEVEIGGVLYSHSADKAARFILECNQMKIPLLFLQDVVGFMVGKEAEQSGIIKSGAKLVNAVSNSIVPKITVIIGNSFGAGHYALCGKAYDPRFILAWPNAKYAVMGKEQAAGTLLTIRTKSAERKGTVLKEEDLKAVQKDYEKQMDIRYGAARGWIDAIIPPHKTRNTVIQILNLVKRRPQIAPHFLTGVIQT